MLTFLIYSLIAVVFAGVGVWIFKSGYHFAEYRERKKSAAVWQHCIGLMGLARHIEQNSPLALEEARKNLIEKIESESAYGRGDRIVLIDVVNTIASLGALQRQFDTIVSKQISYLDK